MCDNFLTTFPNKKYKVAFLERNYQINLDKSARKLYKDRLFGVFEFFCSPKI